MSADAPPASSPAFLVRVAAQRRSPAQLAAELEQRLAQAPRCWAARYLRACACFDRGLPAIAARHLMIAQHAQPQLESAALLAFTGLAWAQRESAPLLRVLIDTWTEFRRPEFDRTPTERRLLDAFAEPMDDRLVSPIGRRLWRLPIRSLRTQIVDALAAGPPEMTGLLLASG